jgi:hypothetical protein
MLGIKINTKLAVSVLISDVAGSGQEEKQWVVLVLLSQRLFSDYFSYENLLIFPCTVLN